MKKIKLGFLLLLLCFLFSGCGGKLTNKLPNLIRGRWVIRSNENWLEYDLNLDNEGNFRRVIQLNSGDEPKEEKGTYSYSYNEFNFTNPSGIIVFAATESTPELTYSFEEELNATWGQVALKLVRRESSQTEKLNFDYLSYEEMGE